MVVNKCLKAELKSFQKLQTDREKLKNSPRASSKDAETILVPAVGAAGQWSQLDEYETCAVANETTEMKACANNCLKRHVLVVHTEPQGRMYGVAQLHHKAVAATCCCCSMTGVLVLGTPFHKRNGLR